MEKKNRTKFNVSKNPADRTYDGVVYDSRAEMMFYRDIVLPGLENGEIVECRKQVPFVLQEAFRRVDKDGKDVAVRKIDYVADYELTYSDGSKQVIDTKGFADSVALMKRKMFWFHYPDVDYRWITYSKIDGGWVDYDDLKKARKERKKLKHRRKGDKMKVLNFQERNEFLDEVVKACTIDGDYQPALLDVVFRLTVLKYFADYDYRSEPQSEWPRIAYESFNFKINKAGCDTSAFWDQYDSLEKAVHEQIDRSHKEWLVLGLCGKLNEIIKKPDPISDFVDFMENYLNDVKGNLKDFDVEKFSEVTSALLDNKQEISAVLAKDKKE